jgi:3-isopropylmalate dehydrogenase
MILSTAMLLQWMGENKNDPRLVEAAAEIDKAVDKVLMDPASRTSDLNGPMGCKEFGSLVATAVAEM